MVALTAACGGSRIVSSRDPVSEDERIVQEPVVTLGEGNVTPQVLHLYEGRRVTFVNADTRPRTIFGDIHPAHRMTECQPVNVGTLEPGERHEVDWPAAVFAICYFHEEAEPDRRSLQGVVVVH